jgi:hypothetical protein
MLTDRSCSSSATPSVCSTVEDDTTEGVQRYLSSPNYGYSSPDATPRRRERITRNICIPQFSKYVGRTFIDATVSPRSPFRCGLIYGIVTVTAVDGGEQLHFLYYDHTQHPVGPPYREDTEEWKTVPCKELVTSPKQYRLQ